MSKKYFIEELKIAICFSGQARYIEENFHNIKENLIDVTDGDVFCHFWNRTVADTSGQEPHLGYQVFNGRQVESLYRPKQLLLEPNPDPYIFRLADQFLQDTRDKLSPKELWHERGQTFRVLSQYLSVLKSNTLKKEHELKNNLTYDYVIRVRSDFVFPRPICLSDFPKVGHITILPGHNNSMPSTPESPISDSFAIGTSEDMDLYCDTFNTLPEAVESKIALTGEGFSAVNLRKHGLKISYSDLSNYQSFYEPK